DGVVGIVTIGAVEGWRMEDAKARILAIVDPPKAELGKVYTGRVVSITKFGAFVNILPGRDGLVHISKLGGGKRINNVEDVLTLGQEIEVRVDDIDDKGKVSLSPVGEHAAPEGAGQDDGGNRRRNDNRRDEPRREGSRSGESRGADSRSDGPVTVSFEDAFDSEISSELGDLGPGERREDRPNRGPRRHR
ncbi:MAG: S1 RNA-binding domain-containing protein, partial [Actinomycetota bacterium]